MIRFMIRIVSCSVNWITSLSRPEPVSYTHLDVYKRQTEGYANARLKWIKNAKPLPFLYESTGIITRFTDGRDPKPRSREILNFHRPETLKKWIEQGNSLRERLHHILLLNPHHLPAKQLKLRDCQKIAITHLEQSFKADCPRVLIQIATGGKKTYTAITAMYRLLKFANAKCILFLVDTKNLGEQAEQEMMSYVPLDDNRKFTELYTVQRLKSSVVATDSQVCTSTIQRLYSILKDKELDECHLSIYNLWLQVLDYFDASLVGFTATSELKKKPLCFNDLQDFTIR